jgi:hypothetical protein
MAAGGMAVTGPALATGGVTATGGMMGTGGAMATGSVTTTGGTVGTGGTLATGGVAATGGTVSAGGVMATGGMTTTGGTLSTGGMTATGGMTTTGGSTATGGVTTTGGTVGTVGTGGAGATGGHGTGGAASTGTTCPTPEEETFSFFLMSLEAVQRESGSPDGFGGDLGGLAGADAICQRVAEYVSPCQSSKVWHAFLSTSTEDAIDRIGQGPWYDRVGRLFANNITELLNDRPISADPAIIDDFPNEYGIPNRNPDGTGDVDNHEILTGSGEDGRLYTQAATTGGMMDGTSCGDGEEWTIEKATCWDWTSSEPQGCPRVGHSWPREMSGVNWISVWNEGGCAPGGVLEDVMDNSRRVGAWGGYGGWYCFAVTP